MSTIIPIADNGQVFLPKEIIKGFKKPLIVFEESDGNYFLKIMSEKNLKQVNKNDDKKLNFFFSSKGNEILKGKEKYWNKRCQLIDKEIKNDKKKIILSKKGKITKESLENSLWK